MVASDTETVEDAAKKHLYIEPEYVLSVMRPKAGQEILPVRTITFHRDDMLPYDQYVYDSEGVLETQIFYSNYTTFSAGKYPSKVTIKRPQEGIQIVLTVERVEENVGPSRQPVRSEDSRRRHDQESEISRLGRMPPGAQGPVEKLRLTEKDTCVQAQSSFVCGC